MCPFTSPDNRHSQAEFVRQRCGHRDNVDHNAAMVIAKRNITKLLPVIPLTKKLKPTRIFRIPWSKRSEATSVAHGPDAEINEPGTFVGDLGPLASTR